MNKRIWLLRAGKLLVALASVAVLAVFLDYAIDFRPPGIHSSYRFPLKALPFDQPIWLQQDNLRVLVVRRSQPVISALQSQTEALQDPDSSASRQPDFARNRLRSSSDEYFVAYATGTDMGCPLISYTSDTVKEACGAATYDFAGRARSGQNRFQNLRVPDYNFNLDFTLLTIRP